MLFRATDNAMADLCGEQLEDEDLVHQFMMKSGACSLRRQAAVPLVD